jgi:hypothetical protein
MNGTRLWTCGIACLLAGFLGGCAAPHPAGPRPLRFTHDTLAFTNQTHWSYSVDPVTRRQTHVRRDPPPTYALRCFVMARTVKQFHLHATFDPSSPAPDAAEARRLIRRITRRSARQPSPPDRRVTVPGYDNLRTFSTAWPSLFQEECGGAWQSYVQRGHWRMFLPFTQDGQRDEARSLMDGVLHGHAPVVHVVQFPALAINHALVLLQASVHPDGIRFTTYDPNTPTHPVELLFDRPSGQFILPPTPYFRGGPVSVYEIFCSPLL